MIENVTVRRALEFAIEAERIGAQFYSRLAETWQDEPELTEMLATLARDETRHEQQVRDILEGLGAAAGDELPAAESDYLRAISTAEIFYGNHDPLAAVAGTPDRDDALELAHHLEKSTLLYYVEMKRLLGAAAGPLDELIAMEKEHLRKVIGYALTGAKMRGLSDPF